jgi:hypothetical protein
MPLGGHTAYDLRVQFGQGWQIGYTEKEGVGEVKMVPESKRARKYIDSITLCFDLKDITLERVAADLVQYIAGSFTMAAVCGAAATAVGYALLVLCKRTPGHE